MILESSAAAQRAASQIEELRDYLAIKRVPRKMRDETVPVTLESDNSSALTNVEKKGVGRMRHIELKDLWINGLVARKVCLRALSSQCQRGNRLIGAISMSAWRSIEWSHFNVGVAID